jgi:uncharacterized repeat protein (TIGR03803 family)
MINSHTSIRTTALSLRPALILAILVLLAATSVQSQTFTLLYSFGANLHDPTDPYLGPMAQGRDGNLYNTTDFGGANNVGTLVRLTPTGSMHLVYTFGSYVGSYPIGGLSLATDGEFYGSTEWGGSGGGGTVFRVSSTRKLTTLHTFTGNGDGMGPRSAPILGFDGSWYGTASDRTSSAGNGTVYKITPTGQFSILHQFNGNDGRYPQGPLFQATDGNFYGTTLSGGTLGYGTAFRITPAGQHTVLYSFDYGQSPEYPLIQGNDGALYGCAGDVNASFLFKLTLAGKLTVLYTFTPGTGPSGLALATDGNFYGGTWGGGTYGVGTIFQFTPAGTFTTLYNFENSTVIAPTQLVQHTNGLLYGEGGGGLYDLGMFFSFDMGLSPFVSLVSTVGKAGRTVDILGQGFTGTSDVSFNGVPASFTVRTDTDLTAVVPPGATTGFVTVTTPTGMLTSNNKLRVRP